MEDFFDLEAISRKYRGLKIISTEEFLLEHAMTGKLTHDGKPSFPPKNQTDWNRTFLKSLKQWLKTVTVQIEWRPEDCIAAFPARNDPHNVDALEQAKRTIVAEHGALSPDKWVGRPTPVDGPVKDRMAEVLTQRSKLCDYDNRLQSETYLYYKILYDVRNYTLSHEINLRLLIHYYCFFFFEDWKQDLWSKRMIRDGLRYRDDVQCAAARIVHEIRQRVRARTGGKLDIFDSFHIRRDVEFETQYGNLTDGSRIYASAKDDLEEGSTVFIASDETNKTFFAPLVKHYDVLFLDDFPHLLNGINPNYYPLVDQLVASRGRTFFGAWCSTFTGYINRMRGYHSTKDKLPGYKEGVLNSFFYNFQAEGKREKMRVYHPPVERWFQREFPIAWRDIDHDVTDFLA